MKKGYENMLKLHYIEFFLRSIPEALLVIWGICIVARKSINMKIYIFSSIIVAVINFSVRILPVYFGVHTFIAVTLIICIMTIVGIPIVNSIYGTLIMFLILSLSEYLNMKILSLLNININVEFINPIKKSILGSPSLIILGLFVIIIRYFIKREEKLKNVTS